MGRRGPFEMGVTSQQEVKVVFADIVDKRGKISRLFHLCRRLKCLITKIVV